MIKLDAHCVTKFGLSNEPGGTVKTWTYRKFSFNIDNIKKYGETYIKCPHCGRQLQITVFPGLSPYKAALLFFKVMHPTIKDKRSTRIVDIIFWVLFISFPIYVLAAVLLPGLREWFTNSSGFWGTLIAIFGIACAFSWIGFVFNVIADTHLKIHVCGSDSENDGYTNEPPIPTDNNKTGHQFFYKGSSNINELVADELDKRALFYK